MKRIYNAILILFAVLLLVSCRKDDVNYQEDIVVIQEQEDSEVGLEGHITDTNYQSVGGATVIVGDQSVETDQYGYFRFEEIPTINGTIILSIEKEGYIPQYKKITSRSDGNSTFLKSSLISKENIQSTFESNVGGTVIGNGDHKVTFLANSLTNKDGSDYSGSVVFSSYFIDPTRDDLAYVMPGDLSGINFKGDEVQLVSFGMLYGELTTPAGLPLLIKEESPATIEMKIPAEIVNNAADEIPLWSLDETSATWLEEGVALKQEGKYVAQVTHFSFWNCDEQFPLVDIEGCALDQNSLPISNATIFVNVPGYGDTRYCTTDRNGCFVGKVPANEDLLVGVYNLCDEAVAQSLGPLSTSTNVGNLDFDISDFATTLSGSLKGCDIQPLTPGFLETTNQLGAINLIPVNEDGSYLSTISVCNDPTLDIRGIDPNGLVASDIVSYNLSQGLNVVSDIVVCDDPLDEYLTLNINGLTQLFTDIEAARASEILLLTGSNSIYNISMEVLDSDPTSPIQSIKVTLADGNIVLDWDQDSNDFISFTSTETGELGQLVSGAFEGDYQGISFQSEYKITITKELTSISGMVWDDINQNGIREVGELPIGDVEISLENMVADINIMTLTDENGQYAFYGSHLDVNNIKLLLPENYFLSDVDIGSDDTVDSDFINAGGGTSIQLLIQNYGQEKANIDAGIYRDPDSFCDNIGVNDPCITGEGDLCKEIVTTEAGINFDNIQVRQGGSIIFESGAQTSPYLLCDLSYNADYNVTCFLDNGIECETNFRDIGTILDSTFFYVSYVQCDPLIAEVIAIPNQNTLLGIDYQWSNGSTEDMVTLNEGETVSVTTTSTADNCARTSTYTLEKARAAIGGVVWKDSPAGIPNEFDPLDLERVQDVRMQLYSEDGTFIKRFTTSVSGAYQFYIDIPNGNYYIQAVNIPAGLDLVEKGQGGDPDFDSDFNPNGRTDLFTVDDECTTVENIDLGLR